MPSKNKTAAADQAALPQIPAELLEQLIPGPVTPGQLEDIFQRFKKAFIERALGGASGLTVIRAILDGQRDPQRLLALCDVQIRRAKAERVTESLRGTWADEHLFALRQALQSWDHYQGQIAEVDRQVQALLFVMCSDPTASDPASRLRQAMHLSPLRLGGREFLRRLTTPPPVASFS
jgi:hypothetical protein